MNKAQMEDEFDFRISLEIAKNMRKDGLLTQAEYEKTKRLLLQKYTPVISSLGD